MFWLLLLDRVVGLNIPPSMWKQWHFDDDYDSNHDDSDNDYIDNNYIDVKINLFLII